MPFFRRTEISDADLDAIAAYLTRARKVLAGCQSDAPPPAIWPSASMSKSRLYVVPRIANALCHR